MLPFGNMGNGPLREATGPDGRNARYHAAFRRVRRRSYYRTSCPRESDAYSGTRKPESRSSRSVGVRRAYWNPLWILNAPVRPAAFMAMNPTWKSL